jgi:coenzyme F420-0:L-glutamate ligase / coenzyme F420-1:gamma-L-glutamate ligase
MTLTLTTLPNIPLIHPGDSIAEIILNSLQEAKILVEDGDVIVLAQKIVSKAEGRLENLTQVAPGERAKQIAEEIDKDPRLVELILRESREVLRTRPGTIVVEHRNGFVCANAGIDHSNVHGDWGKDEDWVLLLPEDPDASARKIRDELEVQTGKKLAVLIIDSHGRAWRLGTVGTVIGLAGIPGVVDQRGWADLFGFKLRITQVAAADELAAAASLLMGQANEGTPVVHVRGFPYPLRESSMAEILRPKELDMFR